MAISTVSGWQVQIGPVVATPPVSSTAYAALTPYTALGEVENIGEFGDEANAVTFLSLSAGRVRKAKGARNAGDVVITCGRDALDAGQVAMKAAEGTSFQYAFRITANDKLDANDTNSIFYFTALVGRARNTAGGADDVTKIAFTLAINSLIVEVPATVVP